jgi:hypothetical protein
MQVALSLQLLQHANRRSHFPLVPKNVGKVKLRCTVNIHSQFSARLGKLGQADCGLQGRLRNTMTSCDLQ